MNWARTAIAVFLFGIAFALPVRAEHDQARVLREAGVIVPLECILEAVRARYPGRLLEAELESPVGGYLYEIEWVGADGIVQELSFDARTGKPLEVDCES